jgi:hypothetical protein
LFDCLPSYEVALGVLDSDGKPTTARFTFRERKTEPTLRRRRASRPTLWFSRSLSRQRPEDTLADRRFTQ